MTAPTRPHHRADRTATFNPRRAALGVLAAATIALLSGALATPAPADAAETVLLSEDFSGGGIPSGWNVIEGNWSVADGALTASGGGERSRISFGPAAPENFALEATVRFDAVANPARWLNIGFDYHAADDFGSVLVARSNTQAANGLELAQKSTPTGGWSSAPVAAAPDSIGVGEDHTLQLEVRGTTMTARLDGAIVITAANLVRTGGSFGFVINNSTVAFDDIELRELDEGAAPVDTVDGYPLALNGHAWPSGHVQGVAFDEANRVMYYSFTDLLVKTDLAGEVLGTLEGWTGHLGDLDLGDDGRIYGSLEYKAQEAFYIAVVDGAAIDRIGMRVTEAPEVFRTVYLPEVVTDYTADMNGDGVFDGNVGATPDHRYGSSGIDGVSFGPAFGSTDGPRHLTVAYGIYENNERTDNDYQVLLQYNTSEWDAYLDVLDETDPHHSGPDEVDGKYFVFTGNTRYGVQNLDYDEWLERWYLGVYTGSKPAYPNYSLFAVDATVAPQLQPLLGQPQAEDGMVIPLSTDGQRHDASGVTGWMQKADVGFQALGNGLYYAVTNGSASGQQTATAQLVYWTGRADQPFAPATPGFRSEPALGAPIELVTTAGEPFTGSLAATDSAPSPAYRVDSGSLPEGVDLVAATGLLTGTPTLAGSWDAAVTADNGGDATSTTPIHTTVVTGETAALAVTLDGDVSSVRVGDIPQLVVTGRDRFGNDTGAVEFAVASSIAADIVDGAFAPTTPGERLVTVTSGELHAEIAVTVLPAAGGGSGPGSPTPGDDGSSAGDGSLANTGSDGQPVVAALAALLTLGAGAVSVTVSRRRKASSA